MSYSIGPLKVTIEKEFAETRNLEITNNTNKNVTEVIKIASTNAIDNLNFSKGSEFVNLTEGGIGKNDMTFSINMPPKSIISGVASTGGTLIVYSRSSKTDK